jgi:hypothetical protein
LIGHRSLIVYGSLTPYLEIFFPFDFVHMLVMISNLAFLFCSYLPLAFFDLCLSQQLLWTTVFSAHGRIFGLVLKKHRKGHISIAVRVKRPSRSKETKAHMNVEEKAGCKKRTI